MEQRQYVQRLLDAYRMTPGTVGAVRRPDRLFAAQLYERAVPLDVAENALTLAAARRLARACGRARREPSRRCSAAGCDSLAGVLRAGH